MSEQIGPSAKIIADSVSEQGHRLTTMEVVMHRFVLAEFNTHRALSRNSASSRAVPFEKMLKRVRENPCYPVHWGAEQKGMQSGDALNDPQFWEVGWEAAKDKAIRCAEILHSHGLHKSLVNRLLEPFMWHTVIVSATEWDNFFHQRCHPDAQPEMKAAADAMQRAYYTSKPKVLTHGEWHLPYITPDDWIDLSLVKSDPYKDSSDALSFREKTDVLKRVSVARCARVSYLTHDGKRSLQADIDMFNNTLYAKGHWSPFEHVATPVTPTLITSNFIGWYQYRKEFPAENRTRFIPNLPELAQIAMKMEARI